MTYLNRDMTLNDTISAIATPHGRGALGIVRVSGADTLRIIMRLFRCQSFPSGHPETHRLYHGFIVDPADGSDIDEVLLSYFRASSSYTGEDAVEIYCHGSPVILATVVELICSAGARPAEPGEFTRRAFLNGRMDLTQAEAVIDLIESRTAAGLKTAARHIGGALSELLAAVRTSLIESLAVLEASIDFPDDAADPDMKSLLAGLRQSAETVRNLTATFHNARHQRDGFQVVIAGKPNVGKSSLLNAIAGFPRALVSPSPGTTRDIVHEELYIDSLPVRLSDTAGVHAGAFDIEQMGIRNARQLISDADVLLAVFDGSMKLDTRDDFFTALLPDKSTLPVINKSDLPCLLTPDDLDRCEPYNRPVIVSALENTGIDDLKKAISDHIQGAMHDMGSEPSITSLRQKDLLAKAGDALARAETCLQHTTSPECAAADIRAALRNIDEVTGHSITEDVLDTLFDRFCIGK